MPFTTTELERDLALRLGIPMYGADPAFATFGTKSGGRRLFAEEGVRHPRGTGDLHRAEEVVVALGELRAAEPGLRRAILKLDDAVSGEGNAEIHLSGLPAPGSPGEPEALAERVGAMRCEKLGLAATDFLVALQRKGGIVEERVEGSEVRSPSAQLRITPLGEVQLLSTHDQLLGGPSGQSFLGCRFPADPSYSVAIAREAAKVGERLRREGVLGRFAVDFVVVRDEAGEWSPYAIEINLRKGGTTAPYLILEFLTHGRYDAGTGTFATAGGDRRCYVADDHVESDSFRALTVEDVFDLAVRERLHYDQSTHSGIVFHMLSPVTEQGRIGLTAVGRDPTHADQLYQQMREALDREARAALTDPGVPPLE